MTTPLKRIILVEDSPRDAEIALRAFGEYNLANEVMHLRDGVEALDYLYQRGEYADRANGLPALILLDLKMPRVNGIEVTRAIKSDERTKRIPIVIMTSSNEESDIAETYNLGVNSYIVKPLDFDSLAEVARQAGFYWLAINRVAP